MLSAKCSKVPNPVQGKTYVADLPSITGSEGKENIYSYAKGLKLD